MGGNNPRAPPELNCPPPTLHHEMLRYKGGELQWLSNFVNMNLTKIKNFIFNLHFVRQNFSSLSKVIRKFFWFMLRKLEKFPGYEMETENFTVYVT